MKLDEDTKNRMSAAYKKSGYRSFTEFAERALDRYSKPTMTLEDLVICLEDYAEDVAKRSSSGHSP